MRASAQHRCGPAQAWVLLACGVLALCGCVTPARFAPIDLSTGGWQLQQGQALWRPKSGLPEIAGELLLASRPDGQFFVQFAKAPLTLVEAQSTSNRWAIRFPPRDLAFSGRGRPPARFGWLQLAPALSGHVPPAWKFAARGDGGWRFENSSTGEMLEGFLAP